MMKLLWQFVDHAGSVASIIGCCLAIYIMWHERTIERDVHDLKAEEEGWHDERPAASKLVHKVQ